MKPIKIFISGLALLLLSFVGVGFALPGRWEARRTATIPVAADSVFAYLDSVDGWATWTPLTSVEGTRSGPERGEGASLHWDDPAQGEGEWTLVEVDRPRRVAYEVRVEEGAIVTRGSVVLAPVDGGTRVEWAEEGDFGWNPLLAYLALGMGRLQGREMEKGLAALRAQVVAAPPPRP